MASDAWWCITKCLILFSVLVCIYKKFSKGPKIPISLKQSPQILDKNEGCKSQELKEAVSNISYI